MKRLLFYNSVDGGPSAFESQWHQWTVKRSLCALAVFLLGGPSAFESQWHQWTVKRLLFSISVDQGGPSAFESQWHQWTVKRSLCALAVLMGGYIIRFTWWHFLISSYYFTVWNEFSLTTLKSEELTLCSGSFKCKIHLVTFLFILLLVDCFKWALIDCIERQRVHCELWQFQTGGYIIRFTWWHFFISSY